MNVSHLKKLLNAMEEGGFHQLDLQIGTDRVRLVRAPNAPSETLPHSGKPAASPPPDVVEIPKVHVVSERVGVFTFGKFQIPLGTETKRGQVLGTIKGISIQDAVVCPIHGRLLTVHVKEGDLVEFGRVLFSLEKASE